MSKSLSLIILCLLLISCEKADETIVPGKYDNQLGLEKDTFLFSKEGEMCNITTKAESWFLYAICNEKIEPLAFASPQGEMIEYQWLTVIKTGKKEISVKTLANQDEDDRVLCIQIDMFDWAPVITIVQSGSGNIQQKDTN